MPAHALPPYGVASPPLLLSPQMVGDAGGTSSGPSLPFYPGTACTAASPVTLPPAGGFPFGKGQPGIGFAPGATPQQLVHPPATTTPALAKTDTGPGASCPAAPLSGSTEKRTKDKEGGKKTNEQTDPEKKFRKIVGTYVVKQLKKYLQNGKVKSKTDFKHLARKLTHLIVEKEQRRLLMKANKKGHHAKLKWNEKVKVKLVSFIDDYMDKLPGVYEAKSLK